MSEESLFLAALEKATSAERDAFLNEACGTDRALRARVQLLLEADARACGVLDQPAAAGPEATRIYSSGHEVGEVIAGRYKLLESIGEGGMGTVWVAEQTEPVRRKVALKLIKAGMDSRSVLARFEAERQALAVMDHPNIAKVLDGGLTEAGRPFFVMEYVKGVPITEYCDTARLSIAERLSLFTQVCHAVQHAHQKGIIHRDLKPSNILVAPYDDRPVPKVIDFGLAKAMHQSLTERTLHTAHEMVLGTPLYMSPEQAQLNNLDVDTRSDIYSLGVLLYELLTGTTPLEKQRFKQAAWDEVKRIIREEDPPRPSLRLSSVDTLPSLAAGRQIDPLRLTKLVRGELDWIVMKSLEKDRTRRYETANGFAMDIQRYLSGEPVMAAPPSASYRLQKFVRKYRGTLTTAAGITGMLLAGVAISTWQAVRATRAETAAIASQRAEAERAEGERLAKLDAEAKQAEAERQQARAEAGEKLASERLAQVDAERKNAEQEKQISAAVLNFLQSKLLNQADVAKQADTLMLIGGVEALTEIETNPTIRGLLDRASRELTPERIEQSFPKQPHVQAAILQTVGRTYSAIGVSDQAIPILERSLALHRQSRGQHDAYTLDAMTYFADAYWKAGRHDKAILLFKEIHDVRIATLGPDHAATIASQTNLANTYLSAGRADAVPLCEQSFERAKATLGPRHHITLAAMQGLASAWSRSRQHDRALPLWQELLTVSSATRGPVHPETVKIRHGLANAYRLAGKTDLALPLYEEVRKLMQDTFGPEHPVTLGLRIDLATAYRSAGKLELAAALEEETHHLITIKLDADDPDAVQSLDNLANAYLKAGDVDQAAALHEKLLNILREKHGSNHPKTLDSLNRLAWTYWRAHKWDVAAPLLKSLREMLTAKHGPDHPETTNATAALASCYKFSGKLDLAIPLREEVLRRRTALLGRDHPDTLTSIHELGHAYLRGGKIELALGLYDELVQLRIAKLGIHQADTLSAIKSAEQVFYEVNDYRRAAAMYEQVWTLRKKELPEGHKLLIDAQNRLGLSLLLCGRISEAAPHLLASIEDAVKASDFPKEWRLVYVVRLMGLYAEWDMPGEVAKWQAELQKFGDESESYLSSTGRQMLKAQRFRAAERLLRDSLTIRERMRPDNWETFETKSLLGDALLGQNKATEAEPLLLTGCEGMQQRSAKIPPAGLFRLTDAIARLVRLYETLDDKDQAIKWRHELETQQKKLQKVDQEKDAK